MKSTKTIAALVMLALALTACSSSSGDGSRPPQDVTVVVPPSH